MPGRQPFVRHTRPMTLGVARRTRTSRVPRSSRICTSATSPPSSTATEHALASPGETSSPPICPLHRALISSPGRSGAAGKHCRARFVAHDRVPDAIPEQQQETRACAGRAMSSHGSWRAGSVVRVGIERLERIREARVVPRLTGHLRRAGRQRSRRVDRHGHGVVRRVVKRVQVSAVLGAAGGPQIALEAKPAEAAVAARSQIVVGRLRRDRDQADRNRRQHRQQKQRGDDDPQAPGGPSTSADRPRTYSPMRRGRGRNAVEHRHGAYLRAGHGRDSVRRLRILIAGTTSETEGREEPRCRLDRSRCSGPGSSATSTR